LQDSTIYSVGDRGCSVDEGAHETQGAWTKGLPLYENENSVSLLSRKESKWNNHSEVGAISSK